MLELPAGQHTVRVEVPRVYDRRCNSDGSAVIRYYTLKGEERITALGASSKQTLVFNSEKLQSRQIEDEE